MKNLYTMNNLSDYLAKVVDVRNYDKKSIKFIKDYQYYEYVGPIREVTSSLDLRTGMVYGIKKLTDKSVSVQLPQYQKIIKLTTIKANKILLKSRIHSSKFFREV